MRLSLPKEGDFSTKIMKIPPMMQNSIGAIEILKIDLKNIKRDWQRLYQSYSTKV